MTSTATSVGSVAAKDIAQSAATCLPGPRRLRTGVPKRSKTRVASSPTSAFLNKEFEHRLGPLEWTLPPASTTDDNRTPLFIHAISNSSWLCGVWMEYLY